ncbi:MAG: GNAT family N-acetyltransferase [Rhodoblastus sp.]|nr:GNAT family N-acetyltransferase [Rhizobiaceae bacterium]MCB1525741.1 GNAT family N-acetyltransferase [Rhodoblastus sp.]MCB9999509.1 GNAT family N-acetyltransferase [Methylobacteriaceae bacterium]
MKLICDYSTQKNLDLLTQAYRLRHKVFVEEMGWHDLRKPDGLEIDQFDTEDAVNMFLVEGGEVIGYQRMLSTLRPHLLSHVFPHLCDVEAPTGPDVWELTRFCTERNGDKEREKMIRREMLHAAVAWGLENGVDRFLFESDPYRMLQMLHLHFRIVPLGVPHKIDGEDVIACVAHFNSATLRRLDELRRNSNVTFIRTDGFNRQFTKAV